MAIYTINAGHGIKPNGTVGAVGILDESTENRNVARELISYLKKEGHTVIDTTVDSGDATQIINEIVKKCNAQVVDLNISIHFNASNGTANGVEVLGYNTNNKAIGDRINSNIASFGFANRGFKTSTTLGFLKNTNKPSLLVEVCFVDNKEDVDRYKKVGHKAIAKAIAEGILNKKTQDTKVEETPANSSSNTIWKVQVGTYSVEASADKLVEELKLKGYNPVKIKVTTYE